MFCKSCGFNIEHTYRDRCSKCGAVVEASKPTEAPDRIGQLEDNMKVDFNGARKNLAGRYNRMIHGSDDDSDFRRLVIDKDDLNDLREAIGAFLLMYDHENGYEDLSHIDLVEP